MAPLVKGFFANATGTLNFARCKHADAHMTCRSRREARGEEPRERTGAENVN